MTAFKRGFRKLLGNQITSNCTYTSNSILNFFLRFFIKTLSFFILFGLHLGIQYNFINNLKLDQRKISLFFSFSFRKTMPYQTDRDRKLRWRNFYTQLALENFIKEEKQINLERKWKKLENLLRLMEEELLSRKETKIEQQIYR